MYKDKIRKALNEDVTASDVDVKITKAIGSKELKAKVAEIIGNHLKNNKELEDQVVDITKNVLIQLYKTLWTKRNFWSTSLKNKQS